MSFKKVLIILLILLFFTVSSVNASEDMLNDTVSMDYQDSNYTLYNDASDVKQSQQSSDEKIHTGYWVRSEHLYDLDVDDLANHHVSDVFVNFKSYETYGKDGLESWISNASEKGIHTHIWSQIFWTKKTGWVNPVVNGTPNTEFFNEKINELNTYASIKGLSGIQFDYIRFTSSTSNGNAAWQNPGGKEAITEFIINATASIREINPNLIISAALMPNLNKLETVYGLEYSKITKYLDVVVPMAYSGNFNKDRSWIQSTTKAFIDNSQGAKVWTGIQGYVSDDDLTKLSINQMNADIHAALTGGALGTIVFRWGVSQNIDFKKALNLKLKINAKSGSYSIIQGGYYSITIKDSKGNLIPNEKVKFIINGKTLTAKTNSKGVAKIKLTSKLLKYLKTGTKKMVIKLNDGKTKTVKIKIKKEKTKLKISKSKNKITITLKNSKNNPIKKAKLTLKHDGKEVKIKTNLKGKASFNAEKGKVTVKYLGNKYYKKISKKIKLL